MAWRKLTLKLGAFWRKGLALNLDPHEIDLIRRYLLGQSPPEARSRIEERLLTDNDFFQSILIGEEELIDDYVAQQLSESETQAFETNFLVTPDRRKQLRFGRRLAKYLDESSETAVDEVVIESSTEPSSDSSVVPRGKRKSFWFFPTLSPALSYSLAAAMLLAVLGVSWLVMKDRLTPNGRAGRTLAVTLSPGLTRDGGETKRIPLLAEHDQVAISLILPKQGYQVYRTRLIADDKSQVWESGDLVAVDESGTSTSAPATSGTPAPATSGTRVVISTIPARLLIPGDYRIALSGRANNGSLEDLAIYPFRVPR